MRISETFKCVVLCVLTFGCEATLEDALTEDSANRVVVTLHDAEIGARKEPSSEAGLFSVVVPAGDVSDALRVLRAEGLPREAAVGFQDVFSEAGLVPTATEENARYVAALGGELSGSIESIEDVIDARVHIALPDTTRVSLDDTPPRARAAVLIKYRGGQPPYEEAAIQSLVSGAVQFLAPEDVSIVGVPARVIEADTGRRIVSVGPFAVTRGSATMLTITLASALVLLLLLAATILYLVAQRGRARSAPAAQAAPQGE